MDIRSISDQLREHYSSERCSLYEKDFKYFDQHRYLVHPFESRVPRLHDPLLGERADDIRDNNEFPLLFFVPPNVAESGVEHLLIMINGFNERKSLVQQFSHPEWGMSHLMGSGDRCVSSVFLPLTFHYWRKPVGSPYYVDHEPSYFVYDKPMRFYMGYRQIMYDIDTIIKLVSTPPPSLQKLFVNPPVVHLYGFSVGGLGVLAAIMKERLDGTDRIASATLLNSAGSLDAFTFSLTGYSKAQVEELKQFYYSTSFEDLVTEELLSVVQSEDERIYRIFEHRVLGPAAVARWKKLAGLVYLKAMMDVRRKLLFINGDKDKELIPERIYKSIPVTISKRKKHRIVGLKHLPSWSLDWKNNGKALHASDLIWQHMLECNNSHKANK